MNMEGEEDIDRMIEEANALAAARDAASKAAVDDAMEVEEEAEEEGEGGIQVVAPGDDVTDIIYSKVGPTAPSTSSKPPPVTIRLGNPLTLPFLSVHSS